jgi:hypothetical protein
VFYECEIWGENLRLLETEREKRSKNKNGYSRPKTECAVELDHQTNTGRCRFSE